MALCRSLEIVLSILQAFKALRINHNPTEVSLIMISYEA